MGGGADMPKAKAPRESRSAFGSSLASLKFLERVPQRELNEPRCAKAAGDLAERTVRDANAFDICNRWIAKVRMVPEIEEIRRKA